MPCASSEDCQCPPGREGAYAALGDAGYATVAASGDAAQMSVYIRRAIAFHGGVVLEEEALSHFAQVRCADPGNYTDLFRNLNTCPWISWPGQQPLTIPGLQRAVSTHEESPKAAGSGDPSAKSLGDYSSFLAARSSEDVQLERSGDVDMEPSAPPMSSLPRSLSELPSAPPMSELGDPESSKLAGNSTTPACQNEVHMNGSELCSTPFETIGPLVVTAPPWRPQHVFTRRPFFLVLRNPSDATRGLVLCTSTDRSVVSQTGHGILQELNAVSPELVSALAESAVYDALNHDPALLAAVAASTDAGDNPLCQLLGGLSSSSSMPAPAADAVPEVSTAASADAASESSAPPAEDVHPEEETGECPICFEEIHGGEAAMRCAGEGGQHHYFHARCLQQWIRSSQQGRLREASCPICRGRLQFNGQRLNEFLDSESSAGLNQEERSMFQAIADGLQCRNNWSDMTKLEKAANIGGLVASAGFGFMLGFSGSHNAERATMEVMHHCEVPRNHQIAQGVGWVAGLLARIIREAMRDREQCSPRSRRRR